MKAIVACLAVAALLLATEASTYQNQKPSEAKAAFVCPPPSGSGQTLVPDPEDCNSYYDCSTGFPFHMHCVAGLHFDRYRMICDYPIYACCDPKYDPENKCP